MLLHFAFLSIHQLLGALSNMSVSDRDPDDAPDEQAYDGTQTEQELPYPLQAQQRWLTLLTGNKGAVIAHLVFIVNNSLSDDLIEAGCA